MHDRPVIAVVQPHLGMLLPPLAERHDPIALWRPDEAGRRTVAQVVVVAGEYPLDREFVRAMPNLGLIACFTVGYDGVDVQWAKARGLSVTHATGTNHEDVADHAIGLVIAHRRGIVAGDAAVRRGSWRSDAKTITRSLGGSRIGIVGLGAIGSAVARRAEAIGMEVAWWGPSPKPSSRLRRADGLVALAAESDVLVVAARAHDGNAGLVSAEAIDALGPDGLLVNVARGPLVDEDALIAALRSGALGGAALDVFVTERPRRSCGATCPTWWSRPTRRVRRTPRSRR